jgi:hypothetical protein
VLTATHCVAGLSPSQLGPVSAGGVTRTPKPVGTGKTYIILRADAGHHIACFVRAENDGGYVTVALANTAVRRSGG